jgi:NitT/TauT family transport system permease protein
MPRADTSILDAEIAGLDALELAPAPRARRARHVWSLTWPKLAAVAIAIGAWQLVVWTHWKPESILPGPGKVLSAIVDDRSRLLKATRITLTRAFTGFAIATAIGVVIGALVSRIRVLRVAIGSMITGIQTMPSIAWFPMAIVLFKLSETAIVFVIILGAAPAVANGLISGTDHIQPVLLRAGRVLGAKRWTLYRHVVLPASLPSFVGGLKQGWAFAWRSLMAGELLVVIAEKPSLGFELQAARDLFDYPAMYATMVVILVVGIVIDTALFGTLDRAIRKRWGLIDPAG